MPSIPRDGPFDRSLAFMAEGYDYIGNRCRRFGSDIFETRLLGRRVYCMRGVEAARMFYEAGPEDDPQRRAARTPTLKLPSGRPAASRPSTTDAHQSVAKAHVHAADDAGA